MDFHRFDLLSRRRVSIVDSIARVSAPLSSDPRSLISECALDSIGPLEDCFEKLHDDAGIPRHWRNGTVENRLWNGRDRGEIYSRFAFLFFPSDIDTRFNYWSLPIMFSTYRAVNLCTMWRNVRSEIYALTCLVKFEIVISRDRFCFG